MPYKYFKYPSRYAVLTDEAVSCEICKETKICLDATAFYSEDEHEAVCEDCLKAGRLTEINAFTNDGDVEQLFDQLKALLPESSHELLLLDAKDKTTELELQTPPLVSWQDWQFPALDGDYAQFLSFASHQDLNKLAEDGDGRAFLEKYLLEELQEHTDFDRLWKAIPEKRIKNVAASNNFPVLAYIFKSCHSSNYVIVWDLM